MENGGSNPILVLDQINKSYGDVVVLDRLTASISEGELVTFVGPSGCGKTTLLRIIGGFAKPDGGSVILDGEVSNDKPPYDRDTAMVFQNYALFPHLTVAENIGYGLKIRKWKKRNIEEKVHSLLTLVQMEGLESKNIDKLSGGQQQRVALARALSLEPKVLLLDEPLSNLDANLRLAMRHEIRNLQKKLNLTTIFVTHDQYEAMSISDRIMVLSSGVIQQIGFPAEIYERPANEFIANFVGGINFLEGKVESRAKSSGVHTVITALGELEITPEGVALEIGDEVVLVVRPESIDLSKAENGPDGNKFRGVIESSMYVGSRVEYVVRVGDNELTVFVSNPRKTGVFEGQVTVTIPTDLHILRR
ncbi:MAG: ABC transporter ATP-binding protein [Candidatus Methylomirabilales bacterium]